MKAIKLHAPLQAAIVDEPLPRPAADEVVVRIDATGLCGSDVSTWLGHHPFRKPPVVLGHEAAGTVVGLGADLEGPPLGTRVALCPLISCKQCTACHRGRPNLCSRRRVPGLGWGGTYADYITAPADRVFPLPDSLDMTAAALIEPTAVAVRACRRAEIRGESRVAVLGAGGIGTMCALVAHHLGASTIIVTDVSREKLARLRASVPITPVRVPEDDLMAASEAATGGDGLDAVLVTAAAASALKEAVRIVRPGGVIVLVALPGAEISLDIDACVVREIDVRGAYAYDDVDFAQAVAMVGDQGLNVLGALTHEVPLENAPAMFERIAAGLEYTKIVFRNSPAAAYETDPAPRPGS